MAAGGTHIYRGREVERGHQSAVAAKSVAGSGSGGRAVAPHGPHHCGGDGQGPRRQGSSVDGGTPGGGGEGGYAATVKKNHSSASEVGEPFRDEGLPPTVRFRRTLAGARGTAGVHGKPQLGRCTVAPAAAGCRVPYTV